MSKFHIKLFLLVGLCFSAPLFSGQGPKCPKARARQDCFQRALNAFGGSSEGKSEEQMVDFVSREVDKCYHKDMGHFFAIIHGTGAYLAVNRNGEPVISARSGDVSNVRRGSDCYAFGRRVNSANLFVQMNSYEQCKAYVDRAVPPKRAERK